MSVFYDHILKMEELRRELSTWITNEEELNHVMAEIDGALHHVVMTVILTEIPSHAHEPFIIRFKDDPTDHGHLLFLRQYDPHIEEKIRTATEDSKKKFLDAIHA